MTRLLRWLPLVPLCFTPGRALDLTPQQTFRDLEGVRVPIVRFRDAGQSITYQPPTGWRVTGTEKSLQMIPGDREQAVVQLRVEIRAAPASDAAQPPEDFEKWARAYVPSMATQVERVGEAANAFMIGNASSRELLFSFALPTGRFITSVAAVDLSEKERLAVITVARREDFKKVHDDAVASLFSWQIGD